MGLTYGYYCKHCDTGYSREFGTLSLMDPRGMRKPVRCPTCRRWNRPIQVLERTWRGKLRIRDL